MVCVYCDYYILSIPSPFSQWYLNPPNRIHSYVQRQAPYRFHVVRTYGISYSAPRFASRNWEAMWYQFCQYQAGYLSRGIEGRSDIRNCMLWWWWWYLKAPLKIEQDEEVFQALFGSVDCMLPVSSATRALMRATRDSIAMTY